MDVPVNLEIRRDCGFCGEDSWVYDLPRFRLYADGRVLFRDDAAVDLLAPFRLAILSPEERDALLEYALGDGGLRGAERRYLGDGDDCPGTTFTINARYLDEAADKTVWLQDMCAGELEETGIRDQLHRLATSLIDFDGWLQAHTLVSTVFEPTAYTAAMVWTSTGETREPWPWDDIQPSDFAAAGLYGPRLARLTSDQARHVSAGPGGGRVGRLSTAPGMVSDVYVRPVLPGEDLPGAYGLRPDTVAVALTDRLRVRSLPEVLEASAMLEPVLRQGDALYVVGGPVDGSGYRWYQVYAPRVRLGGWVAWAGKAAEPWIEGRPIQCTLGASDDPLVGAIGYDLMRLACFKGQPFEGRRVLAPISDDGPSCPAVVNYWLEPEWLSNPVRCTYEFGANDGDTGSFDLISGGVLHPSIAGAARNLLDTAPDPRVGVLVDVVGQLDHPDSRGCSAMGAGPTLPIRTTLECRMTFVITDMQRSDPA